MGIADKLKQNDFLRIKVKNMKIYKEYLFDAKSFSKYFLERQVKNGNYEYRMLLLIHSIEKGMSMSEPKPFGKEKIYKLMELIKKYEKNNSDKSKSVYAMSISTVKSYCDFYSAHGWENEKQYKKANSFIKKYDSSYFCTKTGSKILNKKDATISKTASFEDVLRTRKSVRTYTDEPLKDEDVIECVKLAMLTPTACNRQMCRIIEVSDNDIQKLLNKTIYGVTGFTKDTVKYFVVTFDMGAFDFYGERNQGYVNAGLVSMNFVNALHTRGIGSCFLQWANSRDEEKPVREALKLKDSERIAIVIGAGYYADEMIIPCSARKNIEEIFTKI